jgi:hypothetical protein
VPAFDDCPLTDATRPRYAEIERHQKITPVGFGAAP